MPPRAARRFTRVDLAPRIQGLTRELHASVVIGEPSESSASAPSRES